MKRQVLTFKNYTEWFFKEHEAFLKINYPGITSSRLLRELESTIIQAKVSPQDFFNLPYYENSKGPATSFFLKLKKGVPLEYISNKAYFYDSEFFVNEDVLIPRSETELLVQIALDEIKKIKKVKKEISLIDVGTGSGCILLSILKKCEDILSYGVDISEKSIEIAKRNFFNLEFGISEKNRVNFMVSDRLTSFQKPEVFDVIVSNPPYIKKEKDASLVHFQVIENEPHQALFLEDEEYDKWFEEFFLDTHRLLKKDGVFLMEGHESHLENQKVMLEEIGFKDIEILKDLTNRNRFVRAYK